MCNVSFLDVPMDVVNAEISPYKATLKKQSQCYKVIGIILTRAFKGDGGKTVSAVLNCFIAKRNVSPVSINY